VNKWNFTNGSQVNVQHIAHKITLFSLIHTRFLFNFSIKLLITLDLASCCLTDMVGMTSSVSLTLFMSYQIDRAKDDEITNIRSSKCFSQSLLWQIGNAPGSCLAVNHPNYLHNYKRNNTPFSTFKDNMEYVIQVKVSACFWRLYVCQRWRNIPNFPEDSRLKLWHICPCEMLGKQVLKRL